MAPFTLTAKTNPAGFSCPSSHVRVVYGPHLKWSEHYISRGRSVRHGKVVVGDQTQSKAYRTTIKGSIAKVTGTTYLPGTNQVYQFFITGSRLFAVDGGYGDVRIYPYPQGDVLISTILRGKRTDWTCAEQVLASRRNRLDTLLALRKIPVGTRSTMLRSAFCVGEY